MDLGLRGLKALVTGSSRGLGYATAAVLSAEGVLVALNGRDEARMVHAAKSLANQTGSKVLGFVGDVGEAGAAERLVDQAAQALGGLDLLVTNAGGPPAGTFDAFDDQAWQKAVDLSFLSHVRLIRAALPHLRISKAASVLTVTSYSIKQPLANLILSNSIRAATAGLTKSLALELGGEGIRFNSILPGTIDTDRIRELHAFRASRAGSTPEDEARKDSEKSVLGRIGRPDEFGRAAAFLLSPAASYITGTMLLVDGGQYKGMM